MGKSKPKKDTSKKAKDRLYEGLSKCLEDGHISFATFPVQGADGISLLHACSQCGLMFWEE
jgi:transcription elongation factor Elf1